MQMPRVIACSRLEVSIVARSFVSSFPSRVCRSSMFRRAVWSGLLLLHVGVAPAAWSAAVNAELGGTATSWLRLGTLFLASAFFALKIADVAWLRLPPGRKPFLAALTVVALLHAGAVERTTGAEILSPDGQVAVAMASGGVMGRDRLASLFRRLVARVPALDLDRAAHRFRHSVFSGWTDEFASPKFASAYLSSFGPRAPPFAPI